MRNIDLIRVPSDLKEKLLSVVDSETMRNYLKEEDFTVFNWVSLVGSAPRPMDEKLKLLCDLKSVNMDRESHAYLEKSISFAQNAMNMLYHADPGKSVILLNAYDSASPDPSCMGTSIPCLSYQEVLKEICSEFSDENSKISLSDESDYQDYYFILELYLDDNGKYEEQCNYYCTPNGKVQYFRLEQEAPGSDNKDTEMKILKEIFSGKEGMLRWISPYHVGDILYVDMRPWYRPTYCLICWIAKDMPFDCCGIQCLYPTFEGMIGEAALKHGYFLPHVLKVPFDPDRVFFCPLYRAVPYEGELPEAYSFMKPLSEKLKADPSLSQEIDDLFMKDRGKNCTKMTMVYRPTRVEKPDGKNGEPDRNPVWISGKKKEREWWEESGNFEVVTRKQLFALIGGDDVNGGDDGKK